uniref:ATP synthase CF0 B subunit n=1 Tax=Crassula alstonii TaxID=2487948 RepID=UPI0027A64338|nr:ATP synthase CF0 B subunit [Crassula alstonii]YP_010901162.1 ATP synthase CF0 B subunit [Crassula columella]YP_010901332.1 ATP synthase CF0 B subunit [Crassula mesembryanthoides]YP_010901417.1 ATP synthase CF0 B subunit [Crassula socialis]WIL06661.1 ATP synthase CF0 B subunit [Crassula alstonii]WIL06747.1 ATP synthase CF0 B subunit [Crassula columella]WIL06916.1 ATP synthase CF0 B subunit [Crassula mesembryanthoides]WIL07001.1 ATP synthase CF0 B subunit [Crassula socialis]
MKNVTDSVVYLGHWSSAGSFGFNTDILATNPINLSVVLGVLIFFGKGVCASCLFQKKEWKENLLSLSDLLDNRKQKILNTIQNSEELREGAIEQLEKVRARLQQVELEAAQFRANGYSEIEQEKLNLINSTYNTLEQLENYKNETINFEQQRAINQVRQLVFQQALQGALGTLTSSLNNDIHLRTISTNIGIFGAMKEITD